MTSLSHAEPVAARVVAAAHGNESVVSSLVSESTQSLGTFDFGEPLAAQLKGIPSTHQLFPRVWSDAI
jgi:hypothetical protein